jgi:DNA polymerase-4
MAETYDDDDDAIVVWRRSRSNYAKTLSFLHLFVVSSPWRRTPRIVSHSDSLRRILHVDMDAFYASVEQRDRPDLRGRPVAVGGDPSQRGVVAAASYEARVFGVRSAIPMSRAVRLCPSLVIVRPDFSRYRSVSQEVFKLFRAVTPLVEPLSLDEAYLDVTENAWGEPLGREVALKLKAQIRETLGLTASAGVAPNKFLAKIASAWKKPDGLTVIAPERVERFLQKLPVDALWGVGPVTAARLRERGIERLVDVRAANPAVLREAVGSLTDWLRQLADGRDDRAVVPNRATKSCGTENTFVKDLTSLDEIRAAIDEMARETAAWLEKKALLCRTVTIKVRYSDFSTVTRSHSVTPATRDADDIAARARALLDRTEAGQRPVRLLGASVHNLVDPAQPENEAGGGAPDDGAAALPFAGRDESAT